MNHAEWEDWLRHWEQRNKEAESILLYTDVLNGKTEEELDGLKRRFGIHENTSRLETIQSISRIMKEIHGKCNILTLLNMDELRVFIQLIRWGEVAFNEISEVFGKELLDLGIIKLEKRKEKVIALLPYDLQECWGKAELNANFPQGMLLHQMTLAIRGMVRLYGYVGMEDLVEKVLNYFPGQITEPSVHLICRRLGNANKIGHTKEYVYDLSIQVPDAFCRFYEDLPYKEIDLETLLLYAEPYYVELGEKSMPLRSALTKHIHHSEQVEKVIAELYTTLFTSPEFTPLQNRFQAWGIMGMEGIEKLNSIVEQYKQSIMIQRFRGHTHKEVEQLLGAESYEDLLFWEQQGISTHTLDQWQQAKEQFYEEEKYLF